ncbi:hypothetical protein AKJ51_02515 [candidate division MSBL1 archaeon SCGC-AAA382A20]|uniref:Large ribosomal subunit protein eL20 n=1 Tax=candidate division MSBL1 archaeon SCGC-AAA382A20 TaxID=1698280 RepID=A0A133VKE5_9EURY|nr:hypothetical protein AKJ51_02515 [candidate division MSBL1 archaeon SCGC-AAA382A20]
MNKIFRIDGSFVKNKQKTEFIKEVPANSKDRALERLYSELGSKHAVKRNLIQINDIEEIKPEEAEDPKIRALAEDE